MSTSNGTSGGETTARSSPPIAVRIARALFFVNGVIWLVFAVMTLTRSGGTAFVDILDDTYREIFFVLMALNAAVMFAACILLGIRRRLVWLFALAVLAVNIALTFTDDVGFADWATAGIDVVIAGLLIGARGWFAPGRQG